MRFRDIPEFTSSAGYMVNVGLDYLAAHVAHYVVDYGLDMSPDFQRGYVWTPEQKVRFMEYMLKRGTSGLDIYTNCPNWQHGSLGPHKSAEWFVLVDGKQRLDAALGFLNNEFQVFGAYFREYTDKPRITTCNFRWHVNTLQTRAECLQWYLDLNSGGTVHSQDELDKVRALIAAGGEYVRPPHAEILEIARIDRPIFQEALRERDEQRERISVATAAREAAEATKAANKKKTRTRK